MNKNLTKDAHMMMCASVHDDMNVLFRKSSL